VAELGLESEVDVVIGTLGKALGSYGAYACCDRTMAKYLVNSARTLIFSTALPPPAVAGALAALELLLEQPRRVDKLQSNAEVLREELEAHGFETGESCTQVVPLVIGDAAAAMAACEAALARGVFAQAIRPPTVPEGTSRLRLAVMASHTKSELRAAARVLAEAARGAGVVAAAICAALRSRGVRVAAWKPVVTGTDEAPDPGWPPDHELLAAVCGLDPGDVAPLAFGPAVSPHLAAELAGAPIEPAALVARARETGAAFEALVVEGVGGLLVPLTTGYLVRDLARELGFPIVIAAAPGLGTINHTLLTVEAARAVGLRVAGIVLTPWPAEPSVMEGSNRETVERLAGLPVSTLARLPDAGVEGLAAAGSALPLDDWL
jgi:dethiobiotin synthase